MKRKKIIFLLIVVGLAGIILACRGGNGPSSLVFTPDKLPDAKVGQVYQTTITVTKNDTPVFQMGLAEGGLPAGLSFMFNEGKNSATISGIPTAAGTFKFTVGAACYGTSVNGQTGSQPYLLTINK